LEQIYFPAAGKPAALDLILRGYIAEAALALMLRECMAEVVVSALALLTLPA
jgi:hypothetical protein